MYSLIFSYATPLFIVEFQWIPVQHFLYQSSGRTTHVYSGQTVNRSIIAIVIELVDTFTLVKSEYPCATNSQSRIPHHFKTLFNLYKRFILNPQLLSALSVSVD